MLARSPSLAPRVPGAIPWAAGAPVGGGPLAGGAHGKTNWADVSELALVSFLSLISTYKIVLARLALTPVPPARPSTACPARAPRLLAPPGPPDSPGSCPTETPK